MDELIKAIMVQYNSASGASLRSKNTGGMWYGMAPRNTTWPCMTFRVLPSVTEFTMSVASEVNTTELRFSIWDDDKATTNIVAILPLVKSLYDNVILTMTSYTMLLAKRMGEELIIEDDDRGWQAIVFYKYIFAK